MPFRSDLRNLQEVVHHPDAREPGFFGGATDGPEARAELGRATLPREAGDPQMEVEGHGVLLLAAAPLRRVDTT
ncbi:MAG: hypothetical protein M3Q68_07780 [Actinomycetota bacterium]|nr:hypothetical protein [Actinomycetota bacterium]